MAQQGGQVTPVVPAVVPLAVPWARTPGARNANNLLNFDDTKDAKYYYKAIEWIAEKYGLQPDKLFGYGQRISEKIAACAL
jgi:hypothetical protein